MYSGAYLPLLREDILRLLEHLDKIADGAESCCDFFLDQRPEIPGDLKPRFANAMKISISCFKPLRDAVAFFFTDKVSMETIRELVKKAGILESDVDKHEWDITRDIFNTDLDYGRKIHLRLCIQKIVAISDRTEDAADQLEVTMIKGGI
jgi:predicted phosphate transport protein (TIGR00153 family)